MEKFKNLLWYIFLYSPIVFVNGLGIILLANEKITGGTFQTTIFKKKTKRQIDKEKFAKFMKRVTK